MNESANHDNYVPLSEKLANKGYGANSDVVHDNVGSIGTLRIPDSPEGSPLNEIEKQIREIERKRDESDDEYIGQEREVDNLDKVSDESGSESAREDEELQAKLIMPPDKKDVVLDAYNCDLNMKINVNGVVAEPITDGGFAYMWAGVKATFGVNKGRVAFEVKILEHLGVSQLPAEEKNPHCVRVGWSVDSSSMGLGEGPNSFGYEGTGRCSESLRFQPYGEPFEAGDVITCLADFVNGEISFCKQGKKLGKAFDLNPDPVLKTHRFYFPHVVAKNCKFQCNFGKQSDPWFPIPEGIRGSSGAMHRR